MSKLLFRRLWDHIEDCVGPEEFKSEKYLEARLLSPPKFTNNIIHARQKSTGGMICGEVKLAIALQILGGGVVFRYGNDIQVNFQPCKQIVCLNC